MIKCLEYPPYKDLPANQPVKNSGNEWIGLWIFLILMVVFIAFLVIAIKKKWFKKLYRAILTEGQLTQRNTRLVCKVCGDSFPNIPSTSIPWKYWHQYKYNDIDLFKEENYPITKDVITLWFDGLLTIEYIGAWSKET